MITSTLGAQHFRKELEPAIFASESNGRGGEERHFTAEMPVRKVETEILKVGERRGSAASYCRFSHVPSYRSKTVIISGMGGGSSCRVGLGNPDSTCCRRSTHLHFYTVLSRPASLPFLAKVLIEKREKVFSLLEARGYVGNPQGCPSGGG